MAQQKEPLFVLTPIGRLVQGHPGEIEKVIDEKTKQPKKNRNGEDQMQVFFALAFPKSDVAPGKTQCRFLDELWPKMQEAAVRDWPQGQHKNRDFAWKVIDGDVAVDSENKPYSDRPGFAGCWVVRFTSGYAFQLVADDGVRIITNPEEIKRGYWLRTYVGICGNDSTQSPGIYLNPQFVQLMAYGEEILSVGRVDVGKVLAAAGAPPALPPGASRTPLAGQTGPAAAGGSPPLVPGGTGAPAPSVPAGIPGAGAPAHTVAPTQGGVPPIPGTTSPSSVPPPVPAAPWPPAGWQVHPDNPAWYHNGVEVLSEAQLRARTVVPNAAVLGR